MPGEAPGPDQIIASNTLGLHALMRELGAAPRLLPIARDNEDSLRVAFELAAGADLIVTIGGASVGGASAGGRRAGGVAADSFATLAHAGVGLGDADDLLFAEHVGGELGQEAGSEARGGGGGDGGGVSVDADADADALENFSIGDMLNENATGCADGDGES